MPMYSYKYFIPIIFIFISCTQSKNEKKENLGSSHQWEELIDDNLTKWDNYLSYQHQPGYNGTVPKNNKGEEITPIGLNNGAYNVFTTYKEGDTSIIKVSGEYYGCLITKKEYSNYHFQLKYKWGDKKWAYRKELLKDSGILYHSVGPMGAEYWRSWMLSQEFQIMEGHTGDFWSQANSAIDIRAYKPESVLDPLAHESQEFITLSMNSPYRNYCLRSSNYEKPNNEWNTLDLYCFEDKSLHMVNGQVVMILKNSRFIEEDGKTVPLTKGKIQLQSEAAEIFFKDIKIRKIDALTPSQKKLY